MYEHLAEYTEEQLKECLKDPLWRIENLYYILDKNGRTVRFFPNKEQRKFIDNIWHRNIIPKARQLGFSTVVQIIILDTALFVPNSVCAVIAQDLDTAKKIMRQKIKFAYNRLPKWLKDEVPLRTSNVKEVTFKNGSSVQVSTSARGDTLNFLHVSEYGAICYNNPERAKEIQTGALPAAERGITVIESTAKGKDGDYYAMVQTAKANAEKGKVLSRHEYRMHFAPWWSADEYEMDPEGVIITAADHKYFDETETKIQHALNIRKRAWYVSVRENTFSGDKELMWSEYPSTVEESFQVSQEGVYLSEVLQIARQQGRVTRIPIKTDVPVNTFWDLGVGDDIAIWFHQAVGSWDHWIDYYQISGAPYSTILKVFQEKGYLFGHHFLPHDGDQRRPGAMVIETPKQMLEGLGLPNVHIVPRTVHLHNVGIPALREDFANYIFDEERCKEGLAHLEGYRRAWNASQGAWADDYAKNGHQHAADALRQKAQIRHELRSIISGMTRTSQSRRSRSDPMTR